MPPQALGALRAVRVVLVQSAGTAARQLPPPKPANTIAECPTASNNNHASSDSMECPQLSPNTATYYDCNVRCNPDILIVGDSIVRQLTIPGAITYSLTGGRVIDILQLLPSVLNWHPTVNIVIVHVGKNGQKFDQTSG